MTSKLNKLKALEEQLNNMQIHTCEVYSRVVGYYRPVDSWNDGKKSEYKDRHTFDSKESKG